MQQQENKRQECQLECHWLIACLALADGQRALRTRSARGAPRMGVRHGSGLCGALRGPLVLGLWT